MKQPAVLRSVLITGCSSGIGLASAREMKARGWRVFATARKPQDIARLRDEEGVESLYLDYAEPDSIEAAAKHVLDATGGELTALFNNGAYGQPGAVEALQDVFHLVRDQLRASHPAGNRDNGQHGVIRLGRDGGRRVRVHHAVGMHQLDTDRQARGAEHPLPLSAKCG